MLSSLMLVASVAVGQPPVEVAPPPPTVIGEPPPPEWVDAAVSPVETLTAPRVAVGGEIGLVFGDWGMWRPGRLVPSQAFAVRQPLFPVPVAEYGDDIDANLSLAARVSAAYTFERLPLTVLGSWETYHRHAETLLLGYDPLTARLLNGLNAFNARVRDRSRNDDDYAPSPTYDYAALPEGDHRRFPRLQMRSIPSDAHWLRSRVAVNVADVTLAYKVWTPREAAGVEYRLLAGGRYGGFFADDRAAGAGYEQSASNWFAGFGPHGGLRADWHLTPIADRDARIGFWLDARGGALFGRLTQRFREIDQLWGGAAPYRELVQSADRTAPFLATELGVGIGGRRAYIGCGVRYSHYWGIGEVGPSRLDFAAVAGFLRLEVGF
jgi:hypothetical protein